MERMEELLRTPPPPVRRLADDLVSGGVAVLDGFLDEYELRQLRADLDARRGAKEFRPAGVGRSTTQRVEETVRGDQICWWEPQALSGAQKLLWDRLEGLRTTLNRDLFLGLQSFEGHYAVYPVGSFYRRHRDRFEDDPSRVLTVVLYLNEEWRSSDGGALRVYGEEENSAPQVDLLPNGGRLVCFLSHRTYHEVLPTNRERVSFCGWFRRGPYGLGV